MKLTVLGSGAVLSRSRACSGFFVESESGNLLVDLGSGSFLNLKKIADVLNVNTVLFTHYHPDHTSDLAAFIQYKIVAQKLSIVKSLPQLTILGPKGIDEFFSKLNEAFPSIKEASFRKITKELNNSTATVPGFKIRSAQMEHENSIAYRVEDNSKSVVFSGDTAYNANLISLARKTDLLVADCSSPDSAPSAVHMTPSQCAKIAKEADVKALLLTHFYPSIESEPIKEIVSSYYRGKVYIASDLMVLEF